MTSASYYGPPGPYGTESEAIAASGLPGLEPGKYYSHNLSRLTDAASAAGVQLGSYDTRILTWLSDRSRRLSRRSLRSSTERPSNQAHGAGSR